MVIEASKIQCEASIQYATNKNKQNIYRNDIIHGDFCTKKIRTCEAGNEGKNTMVSHDHPKNLSPRPRTRHRDFCTSGAVGSYFVLEGASQPFSLVPQGFRPS